eukprot:CAMPEP_0194560218 /NCGR_PEP_ID=MMETSP0292-20121207/1478_1 /TAXON_ID=39354 /ORGANISM="Heterosigma akashiwo, Strain CCMP2393" /LENGTH=136 /DNA_ID=CAMNT_0039408337 /DNA_START=132 /DNA_END=539 /DNA_ORIENTATION=+
MAEGEEPESPRKSGPSPLKKKVKLAADKQASHDMASAQDDENNMEKASSEAPALAEAGKNKHKPASQVLWPPALNAMPLSSGNSSEPGKLGFEILDKTLGSMSETMNVFNELRQSLGQLAPGSAAAAAVAGGGGGG